MKKSLFLLLLLSGEILTSPVMIIADEVRTVLPQQAEVQNNVTSQSSEVLQNSQNKTEPSEKIESVQGSDKITSTTEINPATEESVNSIDTETAVPKGNLITTEAEDPIDSWMPDKSLQQAVANALHISVSDITKDKLENVTYLNGVLGGVISIPIESIQGLEYATNLTDLYLTGNNISDINYLRGLSHLSSLNLSSNQISDIEPVSNLVNLNTLALDHNTINDISPLSSLTKLTFLRLSNNQISDIEPVSNLVNLNTLELPYNTISDISPLSSLTNLTSLNLNINQITNISPLSSLTKLQSLGVATNQISDISSLRNLTNLDYLSIQNNKITDISSLSQINKDALWANLQKDTLSKKVVESGDEIKIANPIKGFGNVQPYTILVDNVSILGEDAVYNSEDDTISFHNLTMGLHQVKIYWYTEIGQNNYNIFEGNVDFELEVIPQKGADVTVHYQDVDGNKIADDEVKTGNIGDDYTTEQKDIDGYTFKEVKGDTTGKFTDKVQSVTYVYTKDPMVGADVMVHYQDVDGNKIADDEVKTGNIGDDYTTEQKDIDGYTFKEVKGDTTGKFTDKVQSVTYVYTKDPIVGADVMVHYQDVDGNKIADDEVKTGNIGDNYTTEQKDIDGYAFKEVKGDTVGKFTDKAQTVIYIYSKNESNLVYPGSHPDENNENNVYNGNREEKTSFIDNMVVLPNTGEVSEKILIVIGGVLLAITGVYLFFLKKINKVE